LHVSAEIATGSAGEGLMMGSNDEGAVAADGFVFFGGRVISLIR
jgi:hypothetical protein